MTSEKHRYRKVATRIWADREFRRLSRPQPNGQSLFFYLLTGRETAIIPGVLAAREAGMAEELGWPLEAFREAFAEVSGEAFSKGLRGAEKAMAKADWDAGLVFVPKAIAHNPPQSPNVVTSWRETWDELPECDLKAEAYRELRAFMEGMGEAFLKAFDKAIPKPSWKVSPKARPNQEQEQEQEQEQDFSLSRARVHEGKPEPETETPLDGERFRLRERIEALHTRLVVDALGYPPAKPAPAYPAALTRVASWVWDASSARNVEAWPLVEHLLAGFIADAKARAEGYPLWFVAHNPLQYLAPKSASQNLTGTAPKRSALPVDSPDDFAAMAAEQERKEAAHG